MATNGNISWTRSGIFLGISACTLSWTRTNYSIKDNTSTIQWTFEVSANVSDGGHDSKSYTIHVNGNTYSGFLPNQLSNGSNTIRTETLVIPHNSDGTKSFSFDFSCQYHSSSKASASGASTLDVIPRPATITSATDFNDEENPTITYSSPSGDLVDSLDAAISVDGVGADVPYRAISKTGDSYTFELTDAERKTLRQGVTSGNSTTVTFSIRSIIDGDYYYSNLTKTLTLVNYEPTLNPRVVATDTRTKELTGDSSGGIIIRYFSDVAFNTRAAANKEATLEYQTIICGSITLDDYTSNTGTITDVDSNTFYFAATDNRGHTTRDAVVFSEDEGKFIPYFKLTNNIRQTTLTFNGDLTFTIGGKYFDGSFGAKNNTLEVEFMLQDANGNVVTNPSGSGWQVLGTVSPNIDEEGNYTFEYIVSGLDHEMQYTLTVNAIDELTPVQTSTTVISAIPVFEWGKSDFRFNVPVYLKDSEVPLTAAADFVVEQGTSGTWYYRKWNSGRAELYGYQNVSDIACTAALGNMYRTAVITPPSFPFTVYSPKIVATYESEGYGAFLWPTTLTTTLKPFNYYLVRPTSSAGITGKVNFHIQGEWE